MDQNVYMYTCSRCGNDVKSTARYCMKCGNLNPSHPENKKYEKLFQKIGMQGYSVGENGISVSVPTKNEVRGGLFNVAFGMHMGNFNLCFFINFLVYVLFVAIVGFIFYSQSGNVLAFAGSPVSYILIIFSIIAIEQYSSELLFMKMNHHWYAAIIPLLNLYVLSDALNEKNKIINFLVFVPFLGQLYCLYLFYQVGKAFHTSGFLTALFPFIMIPMIGFGSSPFNDVFYVSGANSLEQEFTKKKAFLATSIVITLVSVVMVVYANIVDINKGIDFTGNYYLYYASKQLISKTQENVEHKQYLCEYYDNTLYFYFTDVGDEVFLPLYITREPISAYIKVVIEPEGNGVLDAYHYYIAMSDGTMGYPETPVDDFTIKTIKKHKDLDPVYEYETACYFK